MGIIDTLLSLVPISDRSEIQFHRVQTPRPGGGRDILTYVTGDVVEKATIIGCTTDLVIPDDVVLVEHDDKQMVTEINGKPYPVYQYTMHSLSDVPSNESIEQFPEHLVGLSVQKRELSLEEMDRIREVLP